MALFSILLCLLLLIDAAPIQARPQVLVVVADGLTLADVSRPDLPGFAKMRQAGALALMSPGLARKPDPVANAYAALGAGDSIGVGDKSAGRLADTLRRAGARTALIGQDIGPRSPARALLPAPDTVTVAETPASCRAAAAASLDCGLIVVRFTQSAAGKDDLLRRVDAYLALAQTGLPRVTLLVVPTPPLLPDGSWNTLTPLLIQSSGQPGSLTSASLSSDTTQTPGLVAARDFAPTVLSALGIPAPLQMTGAPVRPAVVSTAALTRLDRLVRLNQEAQNAIFWAVGIVAGVIVFSGLALYLNGRMTGHLGALARYGLRVLSAWPLALLLAPLADPQTVPQYLVEIAAAVLLLAGLPSPMLIFSVTALVLVGDGLTGTVLVSNSALSEYALSGIRFYGIGNEYMGVLIGGSLLTCLFAGPRPRVLALWLALVTFALSFPEFGAKAGGAVTATATFIIAWRLLHNRPVRWTHLLGSIALGFALIFVWAILSHWLHLRRTHLETAADALGSGRLGYIAGVSLRKIGLAVRVALHPGTLLGLLAFAALGFVLRKLLWAQVTAYLSARPRETAVLKAGGWGCLVALLFNDSGIVAAILIVQCLALLLLHGLYLPPERSSDPSRNGKG